ncbi:hypothetical protein BKA69DRAFT_1056879 [Paraphysoderma sedebokerense]|nr:hypothetical protein BKA69DRAFT_1056879 [Paraphysoderma sedebokerense]
MAPVRTQVCKVCETQQSKYKCSTCYIPYCSLQCYKTHKEIPCKKPTESTTSPATDSKVEVNRTTIPYDEGNQNGPKKDIITEKDDEYEESRLYNHQLRRLGIPIT